MKIFCTEEFREIFKKALKKNSTKCLEECLYNYLNENTLEELSQGARLNTKSKYPDKFRYLKKRLDGRGGFRLYYILITEGKKPEAGCYLAFVHSKKEIKSASSDQISEFKKQVFDAIKQNKKLYQVFIQKGCKIEIKEKIPTPLNPG